MTSQPGYQLIVINILSNILRSNANRTMKFGYLMECNMTNFFFEKLYAKNGGTSPRSFSEKLNLSISMDQ